MTGRLLVGQGTARAGGIDRNRFLEPISRRGLPSTEGGIRVPDHLGVKAIGFPGGTCPV